MRYIWSCFWLTVPVLLLNVSLMSRLPRAYQREVFWHNIPAWIGTSENILRGMVFVFPLLMPLRTTSSGEKLGLVLYCAGTIGYTIAWLMQVWYPRSPWSASRWGFMAPAYTPLFWLVGTALIGDSLYVPIPYTPWVYISTSCAFLVFHNLHTWIVYSRTH